MPTINQLPPRLVGKFVDRDREVEQFLAMLRGDDPHCILLLNGDSGVGKTWLIDVLRHQCSLKEVHAARIDFSSTKTYDFLALCREIRDALGAEVFKPLTDKLNWCTTIGYQLALKWRGNERSVSKSGDWLANLEYEGNIADLTCEDRLNEFLLPNLSRIQVGNALAKQLAADAQILAAEQNRRPVTFFDDVDAADEETRQWLREDLLPAIAADANNTGRKWMITVLAVKNEFLIGNEWRHVVRRLDIGNLTRKDVESYGRNHGINDPMSLITAWVLSKEGSPHLLGQVLEHLKAIEELAQSDDAAERSRSLRAQLRIHKGNRDYLEEQAANYGPDIPLKLHHDIEAERQKILQLEAELNQLYTNEPGGIA